MGVGGGARDGRRNKTAGKCKKIKIILKHKRKKERNVYSNTRDKSEDCIMDRRME